MNDAKLNKKIDNVIIGKLHLYYGYACFVAKTKVTKKVEFQVRDSALIHVAIKKI